MRRLKLAVLWLLRNKNKPIENNMKTKKQGRLKTFSYDELAIIITMVGLVIIIELIGPRGRLKRGAKKLKHKKTKRKNTDLIEGEPVGE
jgi:hypothetical protein